MPDIRGEQRRPHRPISRLLKLVSGKKDSGVSSSQNTPLSGKNSVVQEQQSLQDNVLKIELMSTINEVKSESSRSLWDEACDTIVNGSTSNDLFEIRKLLLDYTHVDSTPGTESPEWHICNEVRNLAENQLQTHNDASNPLARNIRQSYDSIVIYVQKFISVGDLIAQIDPVHVGLPWAGIRAVLMFSARTQQSNAALLEGVANTSRLIHRYAIFEDVYLHRKPPLQSTLEARLETALKELYAAILLYLFKVIRHFDQSRGERFLNVLTLSNDMELLVKDITVKELEVQNYERLAIRAASYGQYLEVRKILGSYDDHLQSEQREKISDWISSIPYHDHHRQIHDNVLSGTGTWFFERDEFQEWSKSNHSSLLWLRGNAGTGKSSLISCAIDRFRQDPYLDSAQVMAYFYCSRTSSDTRRQDPREILRSLLKQLSAPLPGLPIKPPVVSKYKEEIAMGSRQAQLSIQESTKLLRELIQTYYSNVTIIVDALDECDSKTRSELFTVFARLAYTSEATVKVLISSRNEPDILKHFCGSSNLYINAEDNAEDINKYVTAQIDNRLLHGKANESTRSRVKQEINDKARGVFRWAALQVESLCDPDYVHTEEDVNELLGTLPETLEATYAETLEKFHRYQRASREAIFNVLKLLMCAEYPMSSDEVLSAVIILSGSVSILKEDLIRMTRSLIVEDRTHQILVFAHLSVKEYLEGCPDFTGPSAHAAAAEACLRVYLDEHQPGKPTLTETRLSSARFLFSNYALTHLGRHCMKSETFRQQGRLQNLVSNFLVDEEWKGAFDRWNRECFQTDVETAPGTCKERRNCQSRPAQPLFMASVYGFDGIAKRIIAKDVDALDAECYLGDRPLEVAALYGNYLTTVVLYNAATMRSNPNIRTEKLLSAAAQGTLETFKFLLDQLTSVKSSIAILTSAVANEEHGEEIVRLLLKKTGMPDEAAVCAMIRRCTSLATLKLVLSHLNRFEVNHSVIQAAVRNQHLSLELVEIFLAQNPDVFIIEDCFVSAAGREQGMRDSVAVVKVLLAHPKRCKITEEILYRIASWGRVHSARCLELLIPHVEEFELSEDLLSAAARNHSGGLLILDFFIHLTETPNITQQVLRSAILNRSHALEMLQILMAHSSCPNISDDTLDIMMKTWSGPEELLTFVLERTPTIKITESMLVTATQHRNSVKDMELLIFRPRAFAITQSMVDTAVSGGYQATGITKLLVHHGVNVRLNSSEELLLRALKNDSAALSLAQYFCSEWGYLPVNEDVVIAGVKNSRDGKRLLDLLLEKSDYIPVTENILEAAAQQDDEEVMRVLLERKGDTKISESVLKAAIGPYATNNGVLRLLLAQPERPSITEAILDTAAQYGSLSTMELLLAQPNTPKLTSNFVILAARNGTHGESLLRNISWTEYSNVTEEALIAAVESQWRVDVLEALLSHPQSASCITENVLQAAVRNGEYGSEMIQLLLSQHGVSTKITLELIRVAASKAAETLEYGSELSTSTLRLLLDSFPQLATNAELLLVAAAERREGRYIAQYLFENFGDINVPEDALRAAAGNEKALTSLMKLLLIRSGAMPSSELFRIAAGNRYRGTEMVKLLLLYSPPNVELAVDMVVAALSNPICGRSLFELLLNRPQKITVTDEIIDAASKNPVFGPDFLNMLLRESLNCSNDELAERVLARIKGGLNGLRNALFLAACHGDELVLEFLLSHNAPVAAESGELGTALNVAVCAGHLTAVKILLNHGANVNSRSTLHGTAFETACKHCHLDIVQCLVDHGADVDQIDSIGRTQLHISLREEKIGLADFVLRLGASAMKRDLQGMSAMHHAACARSDHATKILLKAHVPIEEEDSQRWTPLHWAARCGNVQVVERLLEAGANKTKVDTQGHTAFIIAAICQNSRLKALLWTPELVDRDPDEHVEPTVNRWCDGCEMDIYGPQHRCLDCEDYDLCFRCFTDAKLIHNPSHSFS